MAEIFLKVFNLSVQGAVLIGVVVLLRFALRRQPKWFRILLWSLVAFRLAIPFSIESKVSLAPAAVTVTSSHEMVPSMQSGIQAIDRPVNTYLGERYEEKASVESRNLTADSIRMLGDIWVVGMVILGGYALISVAKVKKSVQASVCREKNIYVNDELQTPFILGMVHPKIFLPSSISPEQEACVIAHEKAHLLRLDHLWKPIGFLLLTVYWFQPMCWLAYVLFCRDIELACDEKVVKDLGAEEKKQYAKVLLSLSLPGKYIAACPLAFGEIGVKQRIHSVLAAKKPTFWVMLIAVIALVMVGVLFLTSPEASGGKADNATKQPSATESTATDNSGAENIKDLENELPNQAKREFIDSWANAFCNRDGNAIVAMSSKSAQKTMTQEQLLDIREDYVSFGWSSPWPMWENNEDGYYVVFQNDAESSGIIHYYAWTSDPHMWVFEETISFEESGESYVVTSEEYRMFDAVASGEEYDAAYPRIYGTGMDYLSNGWGHALSNNMANGDRILKEKLEDPLEAAKYLLNLLDNPEKVLVEYASTDEDLEDGMAAIKITFLEDDKERMLTMVRPKEEEDFWIPQDYVPEINR